MLDKQLRQRFITATRQYNKAQKINNRPLIIELGQEIDKIQAECLHLHSRIIYLKEGVKWRNPRSILTGAGSYKMCMICNKLLELDGVPYISP